MNMDVDEVIFRTIEDGEGTLATKDEGSKQRPRTFPMSLAGL